MSTQPEPENNSILSSSSSSSSSSPASPSTPLRNHSTTHPLPHHMQQYPDPTGPVENFAAIPGSGATAFFQSIGTGTREELQKRQQMIAKNESPYNNKYKEFVEEDDNKMDSDEWSDYLAAEQDWKTE